MAVIKNISYFLAASILSKPLGFLLTFALARFLGPTEFGAWVTLMLIISYSPIVCLGTVETLVKQVAYYLGRNETGPLKEVERTVLGSVVIAAGVLLFAALAIPVFASFVALPVEPSLIVMMLVASAASFFSAYFYNRFAAHENFKAVGATDFMRAVVALLFIGGLSWQWGLKGAVTGYLLHELSVCLLSVYFSFRTYGRVKATFQKEALIQAVRVGFPITLLWWILTLSGTVDRVVLGSLLGPLAVGHYGLGNSLTTILGLVPLAVGRVLYPKVNMQFGRSSDAESMREIVLAPSLALAALMANLQLVLLVATPLFYNVLLPKYQPGLLAGQILLLGTFFGGLLRNGANYLIAANREHVFLKYIVLTLLFNIAGDVGLVKAGLGIAGVAIGTSCAGLLLASVVWRKVLLSLGFARRQVWINLLWLYLPLIVLLAPILAGYLFHVPLFQTFSVVSILAGLGLLIFVNGALYCFPVYRGAMQGWLKSVLRMKTSFLQRNAPAKTPA